MTDATIVVLAKEPVPGRVKTRLMPDYTAEQAAALAGAALADTLAAATAVPDAAVVLALDGHAGEWLPSGVPVIPQRGDGLDERIAAALLDAWTGLPILLIGMDTPQVTSELLSGSLETLATTEVVLGHADDGGWWAIGLHEPDARLLLGVPMSTRHTGIEQERRIRESGRALVLLPTLRDVDLPRDAARVAALAPATRFAAAFRGMRAELAR